MLLTDQPCGTLLLKLTENCKDCECYHFFEWYCWSSATQTEEVNTVVCWFILVPGLRKLCGLSPLCTACGYDHSWEGFLWLTLGWNELVLGAEETVSPLRSPQEGGLEEWGFKHCMLLSHCSPNKQSKPGFNHPPIFYRLVVNVSRCNDQCQIRRPCQKS